jgi:hypothetical protein
MYAKVLVVRCSGYGPDEAASAVVETIAGAVAEGARSIANVSVGTLEGLRPEDLRYFDATIFVTQSRLGNLPLRAREFCSEMISAGEYGEFSGRLVSIFPVQIWGRRDLTPLGMAYSAFLQCGMMMVGWQSSRPECFDTSEPSDTARLLAGVVEEARSHGRYVADMCLALAAEKGRRI